MFLGGIFAGYSGATSKTAIPDSNINKLEYTNVILDEVYATKKALIRFNWDIPVEWDFDTYLHATFTENLHGGNVEFNKSTVSFDFNDCSLSLTLKSNSGSTKKIVVISPSE